MAKLSPLDEILYAHDAQLALQERFRLSADMNGDGRVSIIDVWLWLKWIIWAPGDGALLLIMAALPDAGKFLELDNSYAYGWLSLLLSIVLWIWGIGYVVGGVANIAYAASTFRQPIHTKSAPVQYDPPSPVPEMWRTTTYEEEVARQDRAEREGRVRMPARD